MYRSHTCGELRISDVNKQVTLAGWVQRSRKMGGMTFIDLRDRYGITQLVFNEEVNAELCERANRLGREFVIQVKGTVNERFSKNQHIPTGDIEIIVSELDVLNSSLTPPFTIEENTDGGDDIRMKYRYLDLRRANVRSNLELRHKMTIEVRKYLDSQGFIEVETPILVGSTPEGARDFVVPSRMNPGQFYALPQSPQTLKQLLMVSGFDRYFQIAKCFRDEDLRADRQPEFTQIDCEMSFVEQDDVINLFEGMAKYLFKEIRGVEMNEPFMRMPWADAMKYYGSDKPDLRFGMDSDKHSGFAKNTFQAILLIDQHVTSGRTEKEFQARHTATIQFTDFIHIVIRPAEEEGIVSNRRFSSPLQFPFQIGKSCRLRLRIRHIHEGSHPTSYGGTTFAGNIAFMRQSRFTEMYLIVDSARKQVFTCSIYHGRITGLSRNWPFIYCGNFITLDQYRTGEGTAFIDDSGVFYQCSIHISFILIMTKVRNSPVLIFPKKTGYESPIRQKCFFPVHGRGGRRFSHPSYSF